MQDLVGRTLSGRYRVEQLIGRGGMADVYKVWDEARADHLAMKVLREDLAQDKIFVRRFQREAQTLAKLQHRSIVRFFGLEQEDVLVFLLLEYVEGTSLREQIFRAKGPFSLQQVAEVLRPICAAMHFAHQMGVVHCDLKPGNILINKHGEILVTDFGIARMLDAATSTMVGIGTPAYMAPELIRGEDPTPQTDIYALGVILYEMLSGGERPFTGERAEITGSTAERVRWEQMKAEPKSLDEYNSDINDEIHSIVSKCLEKDSMNRYLDIKEVNDSITNALQANGVKSEKPSDIKNNLNSYNQRKYRNEGIDEEKGLTKETDIAWLNGNDNQSIVVNNNKSEAKVNLFEKDIEIVDFQIPGNPANDKEGNFLKDIPITEIFSHITSWKEKISDFDVFNEKLCVITPNGIKILDLCKNVIINKIELQDNCSNIRFLSVEDQISFSEGNNLFVMNTTEGGQRISSKLVARSNIQEFDISTDSKFFMVNLENETILRWEVDKDIISPWNSIYIETNTHIRIVPGTDLFIRISGLNSIQFRSLTTFNKHLSYVGDIPFGEKSCTLSKNGRYFAVWNKSLFLQILDIGNLITLLSSDNFSHITEKIEENISIISPSQLSSWICSAAFTPNEEMLVTIDDLGGFTVREILSLEKIAHQETGIENIIKTQFIENGKYLITLSKNHRLDIWECNWDALPREGQH